MKCTHFFCTMPARAYSNYPAAYMVTQTLSNGRQIATYVCEKDMKEMSKVLIPSDTVVRI